MDIITGKWTKGEIVVLPEINEMLTQIGNKIYMYGLPSKCFCLREATESHRGILVKLLNEYAANEILMINKKPFCKDYKINGFETISYCSLRFPEVSDLKEVLDIVRNDSTIQQQTGINPNETYWVNDTHKRFFFRRHAQYYAPKTDSIGTAQTNNEKHYRLIITYFENKTEKIEPKIKLL